MDSGDEPIDDSVAARRARAARLRKQIAELKHARPLPRTPRDFVEQGLHDPEASPDETAPRTETSLPDEGPDREDGDPSE